MSITLVVPKSMGPIHPAFLVVLRDRLSGREPIVAQSDDYLEMRYYASAEDDEMHRATEFAFGVTGTLMLPDRAVCMVGFVSRDDVVIPATP